jgi:hypothetical protein
MKFLLDENFPCSAASVILGLGHEACESFSGTLANHAVVLRDRSYRIR